MINGLSEFEKFKVLRPIIGDVEYDDNDFPIINKLTIPEDDWHDVHVTGLQNASPKKKNKYNLLLMFNYDYRLQSLWNNPLKKIGLFQSYFAISTPDFSIYPCMNINDIRHNIYMSRWLGKTWQNYGCRIIPTIGWGLPNTYDLAFGGIEPGGTYIISTLGCHDNSEVFLQGFKEMKRRLEPELIIVYGDMITGMTGKFINYKYTEAFNTSSYQLLLDCISPVFEIKEVC